MNIISSATKKNWERLNKTSECKLTSRANKTKSRKNIIPKEYINDCETMVKIEKIVKINEKKNFKIGDIIYTQIINNLKNKNLIFKRNVKEFIIFYEKKYNVIDIEIIEDFKNKDYIGALYQALLTEGEKNIKGSYYTPKIITNEMVEDLTFRNGEIFLDMCCGSGAYILSLNCKNPNQIYGIDVDPIAVMVCKYNMILKYENLEFSPNIYNENYLELFVNHKLNKEQNELLKKTYNYIVTNPPWGGKLDKNLMPKEIISKETSSAFLVRGIEQLKESGIIKFLVPDSILNIRNHKDIRKYILDNVNLEKIKIYNSNFTGVMTKYVNIELSKTKNKEYIQIIDETRNFSLDKKIYNENKDNIFTLFDDKEYNIIKKIKEKGEYNLKNSIFALGIVTGDNKNKILNERLDGCEPIYTGKEIEKYTIKNSNKYILYNRKEFQQVAPDKFYRANEKLIYKFIGNKLVFSYDDKKRLVLNSANILIPKIDDYDIKLILAILNSTIMNFYYQKVFSGIKILKNNLWELPLPKFTNYEKNKIHEEIEKILNFEKNDSKLQEILYKVYDFTQEEIEIITSKI